MSENPSAFPIPFINETGAYAAETGMTLRDWFAGQALAGLTANSGTEFRPDTIHLTAAILYGIADAMLAEREKGGR